VALLDAPPPPLLQIAGNTLNPGKNAGGVGTRGRFVDIGSSGARGPRLLRCPATRAAKDTHIAG